MRRAEIDAILARNPETVFSDGNRYAAVFTIDRTANADAYMRTPHAITRGTYVYEVFGDDGERYGTYELVRTGPDKTPLARVRKVVAESPAEYFAARSAELSAKRNNADKVEARRKAAEAGLDYLAVHREHEGFSHPELADAVDAILTYYRGPVQP